MATPEVSLCSAKGGLRQYLANKLLGRKASSAISFKEAPGAADRQQIGEMINWWMKHDPLDASRKIVDVVGLGRAYHSPESERLRLGAFLAMLDIRATFEGGQTAKRRPSSPRPRRSTRRDQTSRRLFNGPNSFSDADVASRRYQKLFRDRLNRLGEQLPMDRAISEHLSG